MIDLNPDAPHSPERTAEAGQLFDDCSRLITYATMGGKDGLHYPADAYQLIANLYAATSRLTETCEHLRRFLRAQEATGRLYEAQGRDIGLQVSEAATQLLTAGEAAWSLTRTLQHAQTAIAGLGVRQDGSDG